jgi:hypothetical protein
MSRSAPTYRRLKHRKGGRHPFGGRAQAPLTAALAVLVLRVVGAGERSALVHPSLS